jgi:hypothetical protein
MDPSAHALFIQDTRITTMMTIRERRELQRRRHTAHHEAGHAVLSVLHDAHIESIDMNGDAEYFAIVKRDALHMKALGYVEGKEGQPIILPTEEPKRGEVVRAAEFDAIISLAGPAVDKILGRPEDQWDIRQAMSLTALSLGDNGGKLTKRISDRLDALCVQTMIEVKANWASIERLAKLLLSESRTFSGMEIEAFIA